MAFAVVLDACVLYPLPLRDTLLRVARENLFAVRAMRRAFEDAEVPEALIAA